MNASIKSAVFAIFTDADGSSASFADRLLTLGVGDRATARPLAMEWASKKYDAALKESNKGGMTFVERNTDAERAMYRVLAVCFPSADIKPVKAKAAGRAQQDAVEKLLAAFAKLDAGQKRSFKAKLAKA
jgi:hypothetical protein